MRVECILKNSLVCMFNMSQLEPTMMSAVKTRPTQEQRTDAMRARLLEATLDLIAEEGWAQASMLRICQRAGVSRGAQTHHFPTKDSLLVAAVREIVLRYQTELNTASEDDSEQSRSLEKLFDFLWDACFQGNLLKCWMEVMVAARTDESLRLTVSETDSAALVAMRSLGSECHSQGHPSQQFAADLTELTVYLLRGMVIQDGVHHDIKEKERLFKIWKGLVSSKK